jgi:hypothetical protein
MRKKRTDQVSKFDPFSNHDIGKETIAMSKLRLDQHREMLDWVAMNLHRKDVYDTGRKGLPTIPSFVYVNDARTYLIHGRPCLPSPPVDDGEKVEIAAIHPDFA